MALFVWDNRYAINIGEIDEQHRQLFSLINAVHESIDNGTDRGKMNSIILELVAYVRTHFSYEEELLKRSHYQAFNQHKALHEWFIQQVNTLDVKFRQGQDELLPEVMALLNEWLMKHILGTDTKYIPTVTAYFSMDTSR